MSNAAIEQHCHHSWQQLTHSLALAPSLSDKWWRVLAAYFHESQRHYHTFQHLHELLLFAEHQYLHQQQYQQQQGQSMHLIADYTVIQLAIFFHDIVYNPQSAFNEEDSNDVFLQFVAECNSQPLSHCATKVFAITKMTKSHKMPDNADFNMKFFSDIDMAILGSSRKRYQKYAAQIRLEYSFVEFNTYCIKRSEFLQSCLSSDVPTYFTEKFHKECGDRVKENIAWEHNLLKSFQCPIEYWNAENDDKLQSSDVSKNQKVCCGGKSRVWLMCQILVTVALFLPSYSS
jgi:predicted metal-dependent HD superfamily phosphohydrolase